MMQLKTSGLQFIKKDHVADSIASYDVKLKIVYAAEDIYTNGNKRCFGSFTAIIGFICN